MEKEKVDDQPEWLIDETNIKVRDHIKSVMAEVIKADYFDDHQVITIGKAGWFYLGNNRAMYLLVGDYHIDYKEMKIYPITTEEQK